VREALDIAIDRNALFKVLFPRGDALQAVSAFQPRCRDLQPGH
jgi:peptide/nickel transport system substrate-binding protein/dipeptide transport system substrate-binding protein